MVAKQPTTGCHDVDSIARWLRRNSPLSPGIARSIYSNTTSRTVVWSLCRNTPPSPSPGIARSLYSNTTSDVRGADDRGKSYIWSGCTCPRGRCPRGRSPRGKSHICAWREMFRGSRCPRGQTYGGGKSPAIVMIVYRGTVVRRRR